jgi:hypothetical protein
MVSLSFRSEYSQWKSARRSVWFPRVESETEYPGMRKRRVRQTVPPKPGIPGLSRHMIQEHARHLFRDVYPEKQLTLHEWRLVEEDLACKLEGKGL